MLNHNERNEVVQRLDSRLAVVVAQKEIILDERPLMRRMDELNGLSRLTELMAGEVMELDEELFRVVDFPMEKWNGHKTTIAGEAADVLVFAAAARLLYSSEVRHDDKFWGMVARSMFVGNMIGVDIPSTAVGVLANKVGKFTYPGWGFREIKGETDDDTRFRYLQTVKGLRVMRKTHPEGLLTVDILEAFGFNPTTHGECPHQAFAFLSQIADNASVQTKPA